MKLRLSRPAHVVAAARAAVAAGLPNPLLQQRVEAAAPTPPSPPSPPPPPPEHVAAVAASAAAAAEAAASAHGALAALLALQQQLAASPAGPPAPKRSRVSNNDSSADDDDKAVAAPGATAAVRQRHVVEPRLAAMYEVPLLGAGAPARAFSRSVKGRRFMVGSRYAEAGSNAFRNAREAAASAPYAMSEGAVYQCACCLAARAAALADDEERLISAERALARGAVLSDGIAVGMDARPLVATLLASWGAPSPASNAALVACAATLPPAARASLAAGPAALPPDTADAPHRIVARIATALFDRTATYHYDADQHIMYLLVSSAVECGVPPASSAAASTSASAESGGSSGGGGGGGRTRIVPVELEAIIPLADEIEELDAAAEAAPAVAATAAAATTPTASTGGTPATSSSSLAAGRRTRARVSRAVGSAFSEEEAYAHLLRLAYTAPFYMEDVRDRGRCVFAAGFIPRGALVAEYAGQLITGDEAAAREEVYRTGGFGSYVFHFQHAGAPHCIDGTAERREYGVGRLFNHSRKNPNLAPRKVVVDGVPRLALIARRDIQYGDEFLYDYGERERAVLAAFDWIDKT